MRAERAQREGNLEEASRLLYGEIPVIERELAAAEQAEEHTDEPRMVNDQVTDEDIAAVVAAVDRHPDGAAAAGGDRRSCCASRASSAGG